MRNLKPLVAVWVLLAAALVADEAPPKIVAGPYLTGLEADRVTVSWETDQPTAGYVEATVLGERRRVAAPGSPALVHHVTLAGLPTATPCTYRVGLDGETTPFHTFTTAPPKGVPFRFAVYGDTRTNPRYHARIAEAIRAHQPAFVVHTGDYATNGLARPQWLAQFFAPAAELLSECPIVPAMGTHERSAPPFYDYFAPPRARVSLDWMLGQAAAYVRGDRAWFAWTCGDAEFFVLNSYAPSTAGSPQRRWLDGALDASRARWKIAVCHEPFFSSGRHGGSRTGRIEFLPVLLKYGVDLTFVGHDHIYERTLALRSGSEPSPNELVQIITGGGGAPLHKVTPSLWTAYTASHRNFCIVDLDGDTLTVAAYNEADELSDCVVLRKRDGRRDFGEAVAANALEFLQYAQRFPTLTFPYVSRAPASRAFRITVFNPYADEARGELTWTTRGPTWAIDPPQQSVRIPPGGKAELAFTVAFSPPPEGQAPDPVPTAVMASGGMSVAVPGFAVEPPPKPKKPDPGPKPAP